MKRCFAALAALLISGASFATETVEVYTRDGTGAPLMTGAFKYDKKANEAFVLVTVMTDAVMYSDDDPMGAFAEQPYAVRAGLELSLLDNGDIVYVTDSGREVVCAKLVRKKFLGIKYTKVIATGACEFHTLLSNDSGKKTATLVMEVK